MRYDVTLSADDATMSLNNATFPRDLAMRGSGEKGHCSDHKLALPCAIPLHFVLEAPKIYRFLII